MRMFSWQEKKRQKDPMKIQGQLNVFVVFQH